MKRKIEYLYLIITAILFYVLINQYMQVHEDLSYCFNAVDGTLITSFYDAIVSQAHCYMNSVARFWVHTFVQYFCSLENKTVFFVLSTIMFLILNYSLVYIIRNEFGKRKSDKYIILGWLFLMTPLVGISYLGHIAFVVNYLWASALNALFIALFINLKSAKNSSIFTVIVISVIALFIGGFQESFSICISGALFFYAIAKWKDISTAGKVMIISYIIGTMTIVFAPGNIKRFLSAEGTNDNSFLMKTVFNLGRVLIGYWQVLLFVAISFIVSIFNKKSVSVFYKKNWVYLVAMGIFIMFTTFIAYTARHQLTCLSLILIILTMKGLYSWSMFRGKFETIFTVLLMIVLIFSYYKAYNYRHELKIAYTKFEDNAKNENDSIIIAHDFIKFDREILKNSIFRDFTNITHASSQVYYKNGVNVLSQYLNEYGYSKKTAVLPYSPEGMLEFCNKEHEVSENVYAINEYSYIIKKDLSDEFNNNKSYLIIDEEPTSMKGKLLSVLKKNVTERKIIKLDEIDMKFRLGNNMYYYLITDKENNGYRINNISIKE